MNREEAINLTREIRGDKQEYLGGPGFTWDELVEFANRVVADERESIKKYYEMSDAHIKDVIEASVAAEQNKQTKIANDMESALEAFVRYCYARDLGYIDEVTEAETALDAAIRARGEK